MRMKAYMIYSIGSDVSEDIFAAHPDYGNDERAIFLNKRKANIAAKNLQKECDEYDPDNHYNFKVQEIEVFQ